MIEYLSYMLAIIGVILGLAVGGELGTLFASGAVFVMIVCPPVVRLLVIAGIICLIK